MSQDLRTEHPLPLLFDLLEISGPVLRGAEVAMAFKESLGIGLGVD